MRGCFGIASTLLTISMLAGAQITPLPMSHHTGADAARVAGPFMNRPVFNGPIFDRRPIFDRQFDRRHFGQTRRDVVLVPSYSYPYAYFDNGYESSEPSQVQAPTPSVVVVPQMPDVSDLRRQIDRLSGELDALHERQATAPEAPARVPDQPATLLVFQDRHVEQIHNYAIVGQTLWAFDTDPGVMGRKVPLAELDLAETAHANAEHGVRFNPPAAAAK